MKKIVILDLSKDVDLKKKNSIIFQLSYGTCHLENCEIIKKNFFTDKKLELFKSQLNKSLLNFYNLIKKQSNSIEILTLELFNQRNDKNQLFNKIFNITEIINYSKIKKISNIEIVTDDEYFYETYKSIKNINININNISTLKTKKKFFKLFSEHTKISFKSFSFSHTFKNNCYK